MTASPYRESTLMQHEARTTSGYSAFMGVTGLLLVLPLLLAFAWTGFTASDDGFYVDAATRWLAEFPYVPDQFGLSRTVVSLPISATYLLLGKGEFASVLSTCLFYVALVLTTFHMLVPMVGVNRALVGALLLDSGPGAPPAPVARPQLTITAPADGATVQLGALVSVQFTAGARDGITRIELRRFGQVLSTIEGSGERTFQGWFTYSASSTGTHELTVIAYSGTRASEPARVTIFVR